MILYDLVAAAYIFIAFCIPICIAFGILKLSRNYLYRINTTKYPKICAFIWYTVWFVTIVLEISIAAFLLHILLLDAADIMVMLGVTISILIFNFVFEI